MGRLCECWQDHMGGGRQQRRQQEEQQQWGRRQHQQRQWQLGRARRRGGALLLALAAVVAALLLPPPAAAQGDFTAQVVGGQTAPSDRFPYQLFLRITRRSPLGSAFCGGVLLREDVALTAGHCTTGASATSLRIVAGAYAFPLNDTQLVVTDGAQGTGALTSWLTHPDFNQYSLYNDLSIVWLDQCFNLGPQIQPAKIASSGDLNAAKSKIWLVSGWGTTSYGSRSDGTGGYFPGYLQYGTLRYVPYQQCAALMDPVSSYSIDKASELCAGGIVAFPGSSANTPLQDACNGDSGGPLVLNVGRLGAQTPLNGSAADDRVVGLVSTGNGCGQLKKPGIYTHLPNFRTWITNQLDARKKPCAAAGSATATCVRTSSNRNWYQAPSTTILVDKASAYTQCCAECSARAASGAGCQAFSVNYWPAGGRRLLMQGADGGGSGDASGSGGGAAGARSFGAAVSTAAQCTTCDANCDLYTGGAVPVRLCKSGEKAPNQSGIYCGVPSKGSGRIAFAYA